MQSSVLTKHKPVLLQEVINCFDIDRNSVIVDATFGGGGYTQALLENGFKKVIGFDRDDQAIERARQLQKKYINFEYHHSCFSDMQKYLQNNSIDGIVFDFGVSSYQIDDPSRGFSFQKDGEIDMRMGLNELSAKDVVNTFSQQDLADIFYHYGNEVKSRQIAKKIIEYRSAKQFETTLELAAVIKSVVPKHCATDPCTKTFQALRIFVNDELRQIDKALNASGLLLKENAILVTVCFHDLEDRIVKNYFKNNITLDNEIFSWSKINNKVITPSRVELKDNIRSRSAKLRACYKKSLNIKKN